MKSILTLFLCLNSIVLVAQIEKNTLMLGGTGSIYYDPDVNASMNIAPQFGWFCARNVAIGTKVGFSYLRPFISGVTYTQYTIRPSIFGRYYYKIGSGKYIFASVSLDYNHRKQNSNNGTRQTYFSNSVSSVSSLGMSFWLNESIALEPIIDYIWLYTSQKRIRFFSPYLPTFGIGFQIYLSRDTSL